MNRAKSSPLATPTWVLAGMLLIATIKPIQASALESRIYSGQVQKTTINPNSKYSFPKATEIYNINIMPHQDHSGEIAQLHADGKRVICFVRTPQKPKVKSKAIEAAISAGCDEVAAR